MATTLLKRLHFIEDYYGHTCSLHYIRDKDGREVNFVTVINNEIEELIEVKTNNTNISSSLLYYKNMLNPKHTIQLVSHAKHAFDKSGVRIINPKDYFSSPPWEEIATGN